MDSEHRQLKLFYSYSHKDESLRDSLETHLSILARQGIVTQWHDRRIVAGNEWEEEINTQLETADIILLLISADFIASDYCYSKELKRAIDRHESNQAKVIPVIVRPVDWSDAPVAKLQALPKDSKAVTSWNNQDEAWLSVSNGVREAAHEVAKLKNRHGEELGLRSIRDLLVTEIEQIDEAFQKEGERTTFRGLSTGLKDLDNITDGLHNSEFLVIASRPGMGKTDLLLGIAANAAIKEKRSVAYFSLNLPAERITRRLLASVGRISTFGLFRGHMDDEDWPRLTYAVSTLVDIPLFIDDSINLTLPMLKERIEKIKIERGLDLVVIDSIQHLEIGARTQNGIGVGESISKGIKALAKHFQVPFLIASTISPEVESRPNKRPVFQDLDNMRDLEDDADTIIFIYRNEVYNEESINKGTAELIVAKNSDGPVGTIRAIYLKEFARFEDLDPHPLPS